MVLFLNTNTNILLLKNNGLQYPLPPVLTRGNNQFNKKRRTKDVLISLTAVCAGVIHRLLNLVLSYQTDFHFSS